MAEWWEDSHVALMPHLKMRHASMQVPVWQTSASLQFELIWHSAFPMTINKATQINNFCYILRFLPLAHSPYWSTYVPLGQVHVMVLVGSVPITEHFLPPRQGSLSHGFLHLSSKQARSFGQLESIRHSGSSGRYAKNIRYTCNIHFRSLT